MENAAVFLFLPAIETETLLIRTRKDPLIPQSAIPEPSSLNSKIYLYLNKAGGQ